MLHRTVSAVRRNCPGAYGRLLGVALLLRNARHKIRQAWYLLALYLKTGQIHEHKSQLGKFILYGDRHHLSAAYYSSKKNAELLGAEHAIIEQFVADNPVILDIGAHVGIRSLMFSRIRNSQVFAIEAVRDNYELLVKNIEQNAVRNIRPFHLGMSDRSGTAFFGTVSPKRGWRYRLADGGDHALKSIYAEPVKQGNTFANGEFTSVETIDSFVARLGLERVDLIKIDTEGHDLNVLQGGRQTIERYQPIIEIEVIDYILALAGVTVEEVLSYVDSLRLYKTYFFEPDFTGIREIHQRDGITAMDLLLVPQGRIWNAKQRSIPMVHSL